MRFDPLRTFRSYRRKGEVHNGDSLPFRASGANRDDLPGFVEINLLDSNLDAEHDGRKWQAEFFLDSY
jgi:hypothetical protein